MHLENNYYEIKSMRADGLSGLFHIALRPDCEVYQGHFPGNPVSPGVCNIETVKECACRLTGRRLRFGGIRRCRMTAVVTPATCPELEVKIDLTPDGEGYEITATLSDAARTYMELKGELTV
ncbi:MAG: beta-hydroxyacyl-ACP dehydratase [Prevotellaceae bacterium]|nr:beta-hydroxyacyl-ACP dehydratase [Prevotellaceae bacterium]